MTGQITQIIRHPIKSHGREAVAHVSLAAGQTMPWDRTWAVAHELSDADGTEWMPCQHFSRGAKAPALAAITAQLDENNATVTLHHPTKGSLTFCPDTEGDAFLSWACGLIPANRAQSTKLVRAATRGFTDSDFPSVTLCNMASHRDVEARIGRDLSIHRWRGNIWFDSLPAWSEFDWIGKEIQIGSAVVIPRERTGRCLATHSNPDTGDRDADILTALDSFGHRDFSIRAEVVHSGDIALGDAIRCL
ncbi:MOSC domain-containing protein [Roseovarius sp. MMSF_3281]|uniref:MOSC domain-containing protein n=1 Tax=Roseovarius sp. MMSF_3281 TaxID=3046694 RepID=UPI00273F92E4|nr:MOSC N-terminal beta barrel domain-containing protein [Roseovarius sp. MMSF_3281]